MRGFKEYSFILFIFSDSFSIKFYQKLAILYFHCQILCFLKFSKIIWLPQKYIKLLCRTSISSIHTKTKTYAAPIGKRDQRKVKCHKNYTPQRRRQSSASYFFRDFLTNDLLCCSAAGQQIYFPHAYHRLKAKRFWRCGETKELLMGFTIFY